jgi:hypothetical protein
LIGVNLDIYIGRRLLSDAKHGAEQQKRRD